MGKTILELFENKDSFKYGTVYSEVKEEKETLIEQETSGVRIRSAVELNNPLIYGNEAARITLRSTAISDEMKEAAKGSQGDGGLIGKGLSKLTGGKNGQPGSITSLQGLRTKANTFLQDKLGFPITPIPTRILGKIKGDDKHTSAIEINSEWFGGEGSLPGTLLKGAGGNPKTIGKQALGKGIGLAKDKLRGALFGEPTSIGEAQSETEPQIQYTTNEKGKTYSDTKDGYRDSDISKTDFEGTKLDLKIVSPLYGVRRSNTPTHGESTKASEGISSDYSPEAEGFSYNKQSRTTPLFSVFGLGVGDSINLLSPADDYTLDDDKAFAKVGDKVLYDFIPVWMKKIGSSKPIMFRALISGLTENVSPSWSTSKFVGNPYNFYTFDSIERTTSFNLKMYCNNPVELAVNWEKITKITQMTYPSIGAQYANAPIMQFRVGDIYNNKIGFIDSLTYTIPDDSNWETDGESGYLPKIIDIAISIKFIESVGAEDRPYAYTISKEAAEAINEKRGANAEIGASQTEGDGNPKEDKPEKITPKGYQLSNPLDGLKAPKIPVNLGSGKKQSTPADAESAKLPDNANQGGVSDKLGGKTITEAIKEKENSVPRNQASQIVMFESQGYKNYTGTKLKSKREIYKDNQMVILTKSNRYGSQHYVQISGNGMVTGPMLDMGNQYK